MPSNADHCCLGLAQGSELASFGLLGLRPVYDACSQLPGCSYQARPLMGALDKGFLSPDLSPSRCAALLLGWTGIMCLYSTCSQQHGG